MLLKETTNNFIYTMVAKLSATATTVNTVRFVTTAPTTTLSLIVTVLTIQYQNLQQ